jgi:hypothetical protein
MVILLGPTCQSYLTLPLGVGSYIRTFRMESKTNSGGAGNRTLDLVHAKHALYQLSYTPFDDIPLCLVKFDNPASAQK